MAKRINRRSASVSGQPGVPLPSVNIPVAGYDRSTLKPLFRRRNIRTLIKRDEAKGVTQPEFKQTFQTPGVNNGTGFSNNPRVVKKNPSATPNQNTRVIKPPRTGGGMLRVFNRSRKV